MTTLGKFFFISAVANVEYPKDGIGSNNYFKLAQNFHIFEFFRISFIFQRKSYIKKGVKCEWGGGGSKCIGTTILTHPFYDSTSRCHTMTSYDVNFDLLSHKPTRKKMSGSGVIL